MEIPNCIALSLTGYKKRTRQFLKVLHVYTANVYTQATDKLLFSDVVITHEYVV